MAGSVKYADGIISDFFPTSAEAITANNVIALNPSGQGIIADKGDSNKVSIIGVAVESVSSGVEFKVKTMGLLDGFSSLTPGIVYYLGNSGGVVAETALENTDYKVKVGVAVSATEIFLDLGSPEVSLKAIDNSAIGTLFDIFTATVPAGLEEVPESATTKSRSVYAAFWKEALGEIDLFAPDAATATTNESSGLFSFPTMKDSYVRNGFHGTITAVDTANDIVTITKGNGETVGSTLRNGTPVRFIGSDLPAGITAYTTYYITWDAGNSGWKLYTTEADAVGDTGSNQVTLTDAGTGTQIATQYGINLDDAMQRHLHGFAVSSGAAGSEYLIGEAVAGASRIATRIIDGVREPIADGTNGDPRTTNETRGVTGYARKMIKVSHVLPSGEAATATKFDTGWVSNSDWTNAELVATHNFGANLSDLIVKFYLSSDGTEANTFEVKSTNYNSSGTLAQDAGFAIYQQDTNGIYVQTGSAGVLITDDSGTTVIVDNESWYYKIVVYKPELLQTVKTGAIRTVSGGDWTVGLQDAETFLFTTGTTDRTLTLPPAADMAGREITIKKTDSDSGIVTIDGNGAETIDGEATKGLYTQYSYMKLMSDGAGWSVVSFYHAPYDTGWVSNSDWTNAELVATHNFGANLSDLIVKFYLSSDGTEANAIEQFQQNYNSGTEAFRYVGFAFYQSSVNEIFVQTGSQGLMLTDDDGTIIALEGSDSFYYKIVISRTKP
jgi:hypothetical protein